MTGRNFDIAIAGGGLSGGLIAAALARYRPELRIVLVEAGETLGGNGCWTWFASDLSPVGADLLHPFRKTEWASGYDVRFPGFTRTLTTPCSSLSSDEFDAALRRQLPDESIRTQRTVAALDASGLTLADGERIGARAVIDCRGFTPSPHLKGGWKVSLGRHLRTKQPHGIARPIVMDATVEQHGGCRFAHVQPLGAHDLLVTDTCYGDSPELDRSALSRRIDAYCTAHGWHGEILGRQTDVTPIITGGNFTAHQSAQRIEDVAIAGVRGGFAHPLTGNSLPQAVETALLIASDADLPGSQLAALLEARARLHWGRTRFYRRLGRLLFGHTPPDQRWRVFARFYNLPQGLVERFHAARSTRMDRIRILCGKPPAQTMRAMAALTGGGGPLAERVAA
ncbi:lycopene cyclase [Croceicoccus estronivorus]|uniref:lycopene beta-cyclase CrtY n=1 Tax=Croceicoccus estronivorus TaxID=1172626 RepID=UPI00082D3C25|nr:lycopene beta-cyclase CrtY [Croceicoccus estronivorus]OCC23683.1 lycopene cyclase [Croceicoccus estronivorus]